MITQLVNTRTPENSRLLVKPLEPKAGGPGHTGGTYWTSRSDPEYQTVLNWIRSSARRPLRAAAGAARGLRVLPLVRAERVRDAARRTHQVQQLPRGRADWLRSVPGEGRTTWNEEEARQAFRVIARLIVAGNPVQSRFLLKPLHPDGGGSYAHNGVRRWQNRDDPEWQMLAAWVRGERKGSSCS